jgi:hypothetical protein
MAKTVLAMIRFKGYMGELADELYFLKLGKPAKVEL